MLRFIRQHPYAFVLRVTTIVAIFFLWVFTSLTTTFFWSLFVVWAVWRLDSRIIGGGAIALLVLIPITLSIEDWAWLAETLAVYVFFLLCITVALQMLEMMLTSKGVPVPRSFSEVGNELTVVQRRVPTARRSDRTRTTHDPLLHEHTTQTTRYTTPSNHQRHLDASPHMLDLRPRRPNPRSYTINN